MTNEKRRHWRMLVAALLTIAMFAVSCGSSDSDTAEESSTTTSSEESEAEAPAAEEPEEVEEVVIGGEEQEVEVEEEPEAEEVVEEAAPAPAAEGTLRYVEFSPVNSLNPAASQTAQAVYLYPHYDTLTRQSADLTVEPNLAIGWTQPSPTIWEMTLREDVTFHDGTPFDAEAAVANMDYHGTFEGNPNGADWSAYVGATVISDYVFQVEFANPAPQFPLQMSMVMGMMINPNAMGDDLTRAPAGSGAWIWSESESEAGVTEVYNLNENYWNPDAQGVATITVTAVPDNSARLNALLAGEADIMSSARDPQIRDAEAAGMTHLNVPNFFPYILIADRTGQQVEALGDERVRQAIALSIDRETYASARHDGFADSRGGYYPSAFSDFYVPELDDKFSYDPDRARELLAEAGYPDGITIQMPIMPVISGNVELLVQMLGATGITVELTEINNGELGARVRSGEWPASWMRDLLVHPAKDLGKFIDPQGSFNPLKTDDMKDLHDLLQEALAETDAEVARGMYAEVVEGMLDRGLLVPLAHGSANNLIAPNVDGAVMGLNMAASMPYGVTVG